MQTSCKTKDSFAWSHYKNKPVIDNAVDPLLFERVDDIGIVVVLPPAEYYKAIFLQLLDQV